MPGTLYRARFGWTGKVAAAAVACLVFIGWRVHAQQPPAQRADIGREVSIARHLEDDEEFKIPLLDLVEHGKRLFMANWTDQEGAGRPLTKGTGKELTDPSRPLVGQRAFNRVSAPDANSCYGCHNAPFGVAGGGGDFVTNVFVLAQRFDFVTFDSSNASGAQAARDERNLPINLDTVGNLRSTTGMFGAGYLEMLAREITDDLHKIRDSMQLGESRELTSKGISFGTLTRGKDAMWDMTKVKGLPRLSILAPMPIDRPSLIIRPWHQAANVVSLREFSNTAFNHHHGIQTTERFGKDTDLDGDGFSNEMTRADVTAVTVFQATLAAPGRVIPRDRQIEEAVLLGEQAFAKIGCASCHVPELPLTRPSWIFREPNPYNPPTNLRAGDTHTLDVDLNGSGLPLPRLAPSQGNPNVIMVGAYTDFKLHDITDPAEPADELIDMNQSLVSPKLLGGNRGFLTKRLWGAANEAPYFHHGRFTTMRQAILAHHGEALEARLGFQGLPAASQNALVEFLKTLQVLPPGTKSLIVDERNEPRAWPPQWATTTISRR